MARQKGMLNLSGNLEPLAGAPLDSRDITPTVADLYIASNWPYKYIGMKTTVTATGDTYRLVNLDVTQESSWVKEGSGESGASNLSDLNDVDLNNPEEGEALLYDGEGGWTNGPAGQTYSDFTGATAQVAGAHGLVPAPTTGDISKFLKGDGTWATVPIPSFDYSNTSPEAMNFSTNEKVIGTWTDGKPLYQKTWDGVTPSSVGVNSELTDLTSWNIDNIVDMNGYYSDGSAQMAINYFFNEDNYTMTHIDSSKKLTMIVMWSTHINKPVHITFSYTKTTDSAVASGEKIVGQWVDGKPLYQKTINNGPYGPMSSGWFNLCPISAFSSVIENLVGSYYTLTTADVGRPMTGYFHSRIINDYLQMYYIDSSWSDTPVSVITLQYTKTT